MIVLTGTGTWFSRMIQYFTKAPLNHASIAFDSELREVYSFGRKKANNPFDGGLVRENLRDPFFYTSECAVYHFRVSKEDYQRMHNLVKEMMRDQDRYKYNLLGRWVYCFGFILIVTMLSSAPTLLLRCWSKQACGL